MTKNLAPVRGTTSSLLKSIRAARGRHLVVRNPTLTPVENSTKVLAVGSGNRVYGTVSASSKTEAQRLASNAERVSLSIAWNKNRNEVIQATFE